MPPGPLPSAPQAVILQVRGLNLPWCATGTRALPVGRGQCSASATQTQSMWCRSIRQEAAARYARGRPAHHAATALSGVRREPINQWLCPTGKCSYLVCSKVERAHCKPYTMLLRACGAGTPALMPVPPLTTWVNGHIVTQHATHPHLPLPLTNKLDEQRVHRAG